MPEEENTACKTAEDSSQAAVAIAAAQGSQDDLTTRNADPQSKLELALHSIVRLQGSIPHVKVNNSPAQGCAGIDISTAGAPDRVVSHERLCKGIVHAAAIRELFLWRTRAELSAVPRNTEHELSEENQELEKFALNPKEAKSSTEEVFADYLAVEGHLRTQTGAMNHARAPRKSPSPQPPAQPSQGLPSSSLASPARTSAPPFTTAKPAAAKKSPPPSTAACYVAQPIDNESPLKTQLSPPRPPPDHTSFDAAAHTQAPKHMHQSLSHLSKQHTRRVSAAAAPSGIDGGPSSAAPVSPPQDASLPTSLAQRPHTFDVRAQQQQAVAAAEAELATVHSQSAASDSAAGSLPVSDTLSHEPHLQLVMSLAQAISESNPGLAAVMLAAQQQQQYPTANTSQGAQPSPRLPAQAQMLLLQQLQQAQPALARNANLLDGISPQDAASAIATMLPSSTAPRALLNAPMHQQATALPARHSRSGAAATATEVAAGGTNTRNQESAMVFSQDRMHAHGLPQSLRVNTPTLVPSLRDDKASIAHLIAQQPGGSQRGLNTRAGLSSSAEASGAVLGTMMPAPMPLAGADEALDNYLDDPSLLLRIAYHVPKIVSKELPNPSESSDAGSSDVWVQLKQRDLEGKLGGISSHQGSITSFTISIPHFNTTLSRVNRLEIAAVVEVLLSLRCCQPRNVNSITARNLRRDIVHFVKHMQITDKDSSCLIYPDMTILYKVVLTRIHRWADQIARRVEKDSTIVRRGPKRRRTQAAGDVGKVATGGSKRQRQAHNMQTRGIMLPMLDGDEEDEDDAEEGDERSAEDAEEALETESDQAPAATAQAAGVVLGGAAVGGLYDVLPSGAGIPLGPVGGVGDVGPRRERMMHVAVEATGEGGSAGVSREGSLRGAVAAAEVRAASAAVMWSDGDSLPQFDVVAHIFQSPREQLVDFQKLLGLLRRVVQQASSACGLGSTYAVVFPRLLRKFSTVLSIPQEVLQCVALYNTLHDCTVAGQHYALLQAIDLFLAE